MNNDLNNGIFFILHFLYWCPISKSKNKFTYDITHVLKWRWWQHSKLCQCIGQNWIHKWPNKSQYDLTFLATWRKFVHKRTPMGVGILLSLYSMNGKMKIYFKFRICFFFILGKKVRPTVGKFHVTIQAWYEILEIYFKLNYWSQSRHVRFIINVGNFMIVCLCPTFLQLDLLLPVLLSWLFQVDVI